MQINKCGNCGAAMSCTCQQRRSLGGKMGCTNCIGALNAADRKAGVPPVPSQPVNLTPPTTPNKAILANRKQPNK